MTEVEWGTPPPAKPGSVEVWRPIAEALRSRPNEWAKVRTLKNSTTAQNMGSNLRRGSMGGWTRGEFEVRVDGCDVWARYVGGAS